ncbi:MAG: type I-E CRISPR-associated protein Cse2/CasB [Thermodesulfobacteriota bacterium]
MNKDDAFIKYLYSLKHEDTGTLAALRRACGQRLAASRNCLWFASVSTRPTDFLAVTLAAQYSAAQIQGGKHHVTYEHRGSIGAAWARYCRESDPEKDPDIFYSKRQEDLEKGRTPKPPFSIHERFRTLLDADLDQDGTGELAHRLRGLVRMLVAQDVPIDVIQLAHDLRGWRAENRYVQERWARAFYSPSKGKIDAVTSDEQPETEDIQNEEDEYAD